MGCRPCSRPILVVDGRRGRARSRRWRPAGPGRQRRAAARSTRSTSSRRRPASRASRSSTTLGWVSRKVATIRRGTSASVEHVLQQESDDGSAHCRSSNTTTRGPPRSGARPGRRTLRRPGTARPRPPTRTGTSSRDGLPSSGRTWRRAPAIRFEHLGEVRRSGRSSVIRPKAAAGPGRPRPPARPTSRRRPGPHGPGTGRRARRPAATCRCPAHRAARPTPWFPGPPGRAPARAAGARWPVPRRSGRRPALGRPARPGRGGGRWGRERGECPQAE